MDLKRFEQISKGKGQLFRQKTINAHIPSPVESDYVRGYIQRFFIQKSNDTESKIFEVDMMGYRKFVNNPFYNAVSVDWRIKGTDEQIKESNQKSIKLQYEVMPKLQIYLPNLLQFREKKDLAI